MEGNKANNFQNILLDNIDMPISISLLSTPKALNSNSDLRVNKSHESMTKDLRNTHTTRNSCRDTLLCAISYWNYHGIFTCWRWSHLVSTSNFGLLTIRQHSRATKHLSLYPQGGRSGLRRSEKDKYHQHLSKPVSTDLTVKSGLVLTSAVEKDGVQGWSM